MVKIQIDIPEKLDKAIRHYMIETDSNDKRKTIVKLLEEIIKNRRANKRIFKKL